MTKEDRKKLFRHLGAEIPTEMYETIKSYAKERGLTISQVVRRALKEYLRKENE